METREELRNMEQLVLSITNEMMLHASYMCQKMAQPETGVNYTLGNRVNECVKMSTDLLEIRDRLFSLFNEKISLDGPVDETHAEKEYEKMMEYRSCMVEARLLLKRLNKGKK
jgi:hypothetical protein